MSVDETLRRPGLAINRIIGGELVRMDHLDADIATRCEMLGKMNDRWMEYRSARNGQGLLKLSEEYEKKSMFVLAKIIRQEANQYGAESKEPVISNSPAIPDTRGQWGGERKKARGVRKTAPGVDVGAARLSGGRSARNASKGKADAK
jgi:hypothetical protein